MNKHKRPIFFTFLFITSIFVLSACSKESSTKEAEFTMAYNTYEYLAEAHELCVDVMDSIYGAWYFAIYEAEDYWSAYSCVTAFSSEANLDEDEVWNALRTVLTNMGYSNPTGTQQQAALATFSVAVDIVIQVYYDNGTFDRIDNNLSNAKLSIKSLTNEYADYTGYTTLKSYYSEISSYVEFCKSPTGSFSQLKDTINTYETNLRNYKNDLSFIF